MDMRACIAWLRNNRLTLLLWLLGALFVLDVGLIALYLHRGFASTPTTAQIADTTAQIADVMPMVVGAGVLVALLSLTITSRRNASEDFLDSAAELFQRAYDALAQLDNLGRPKNSRLNWLAAARFLRAAENLGNQITEESHKLVYREQREYWRAKLYELIHPTIEAFPADYYAEKPEHVAIGYPTDARAPLSTKSLAVLYRFVRWPEGLEDPIKNEPEFSEQESEHMRSFGPRGLGELLGRVEALKKK
jgi:hypothetical protein